MAPARGPPLLSGKSRGVPLGCAEVTQGHPTEGGGLPNKSPACGSGARWVLRCCHNRACRSLRNAASPPPQRRAAPLVSSPHPIPPAPAQPALPGHRSNEYCIAQVSAVIFSGCWTSNPEVERYDQAGMSEARRRVQSPRRSYKRPGYEALFNEACSNLDAVSHGGGG